MASAVAAAVPIWRRLIVGAGFALIAAAVAVIATWNLKPVPAPSARPLTRLNLDLWPEAIVYSAGKSSGQAWQVACLDSSGKMQPLLATPGTYTEPRLSPDGRELAFMQGGDIYVTIWNGARLPA